MLVRPETANDHEVIRTVIAEAFEGMPYSNQREPFLVDLLRRAGGISVALVAEEDGDIVGYIAFSPVYVGGADCGWYGLGPLAVRPNRQKAGIGSALVQAGLARLRDLRAEGCVVLGSPAYYGRFGFSVDPQLRLEGVPPEFFMALPFGQRIPTGTVEYHPAFSEVS